MALAVAPVAVWSQVLDTSREVTFTAGSGKSIDSGSSDAVDHPIVMKLDSRVSTTSGVGLGTQVQSATVKATSFRLGRYSITAPTVSCCGASDATSRLIGNEVLRPSRSPSTTPLHKYSSRPTHILKDRSNQVLIRLCLLRVYRDELYYTRKQAKTEIMPDGVFVRNYWSALADDFRTFLLDPDIFELTFSGV
jgi:hypothetical protein